jgi:hypothetical protein
VRSKKQDANGIPGARCSDADPDKVPAACASGTQKRTEQSFLELVRSVRFDQ